MKDKNGNLYCKVAENAYILIGNQVKARRKGRERPSLGLLVMANGNPRVNLAITNNPKGGLSRPFRRVFA